MTNQKLEIRKHGIAFLALMVLVIPTLITVGCSSDAHKLKGVTAAPYVMKLLPPGVFDVKDLGDDWIYYRFKYNIDNNNTTYGRYIAKVKNGTLINIHYMK